MRYDIAHRRNIWENRLSNGGMADVGTLDKKLLEQAERDAKHFTDYNYVDNPYTFGGPMQHTSPIDGNVYPENSSWDTAGAFVDTHADMLTGKNLPVWNSHPVAERSSGAIRKPKGYHAQGQNFDPNYHKKQHFHAKQNNNFSMNTQHFRHNSNSHPYQNNQIYHNNQSRNSQTNFQSGRGGYHAYNQGSGRGGYQTFGSERPAIGPNSFNRLTIEGNQSRNQSKSADPVVPVVPGTK
ncbi:uncharacterized protein MELLADRAFT_92308 [Melampsora larici-populina 98AG31]|uniref:Uncharacterized protein n=1 Tax=Melampsora larici-populina (strain 98AG31 / pathotype 3-4-7) TaxID=747676 RepID=F4R953_MELLP|nr:uncharacterized protein MELLADRAFT_92308 [Melampsora larici-populina 98AG31]EGG11214.1 hypothetical protein MELLADRAFT_92308 [Melampsora larici-populina 98AG31]